MLNGKAVLELPLPVAVVVCKAAAVGKTRASRASLCGRCAQGSQAVTRAQ
jgi:hypothetical protein